MLKIAFPGKKICLSGLQVNTNGEDFLMVGDNGFNPNPVLHVFGPTASEDKYYIVIENQSMDSWRYYKSDIIEVDSEGNTVVKNLRVGFKLPLFGFLKRDSRFRLYESEYISIEYGNQPKETIANLYLK